jgi:hypothetical protein
MSKLAIWAICLLFGFLIITQIELAKTQSRVNQYENKLLEMELSVIKSQKESAIIADLQERQKYLEIDVATLRITRSSTVEEVDKIVKEAIVADNLKEDEYNSLVADTIMSMEENMQLIGDINSVQAELIKRQVIKELKKE